jgi:hypothetical protein
LNNLSKLTTSSLKYAANNTAAALVSLSASTRDDPALPSPHVIAYWITETQRGLVKTNIHTHTHRKKNVK